MLKIREWARRELQSAWERAAEAEIAAGAAGLGQEEFIKKRKEADEAREVVRRKEDRYREVWVKCFGFIPHHLER